MLFLINNKKKLNNQNYNYKYYKKKIDINKILNDIYIIIYL